MKASTIRNGALIGAAAGMMMAMWSMVALAAVGNGFWTPVNAIAHTVWDGAPLDGSLDVIALAVGLMIHMAISMMLGAVIAVVAAPLASTGARVAAAMAVPIAAWAGQLLAWPVIDEAGSDAFTPWVLLAGHVVFGMVAAAGLVVIARSECTASARTLDRVPAAT